MPLYLVLEIEKKLSNNKTLSILGIISYRVFPAQMGGQNSISEFYAHLSAYSKVALVLSRDNELIDPHPSLRLPIIYNHWKGIFNLRYLFKIRRLIKKYDVDIIFIEHSYFGWLGYILSILTKKPWVLRSHNIETQRFQVLQKAWWKLYAGYEKYIHQKADYNLFVTENDKTWAISKWNLNEKKCHVATYGTSIVRPVSQLEKKHFKEKLRMQHKLRSDVRLFIFNGTLDYLPNLDAIKIIINEIIPLLDLMNFEYRIFICGNRLAKESEEILWRTPSIIYLGYVDTITPYLYGADFFINPTGMGGGIKTKLVDALSHNLTSISTKSGAQGIEINLVKEKLILIDDLDWSSFAKAMANPDIDEELQTPDSFYKHYNWNNIVKKALVYLQEK